MSRVIKFRAWDKKNERFEDDKNIFINQNGGIFSDEECEWFFDEYDIQMYTGLNDADGTEIYEGDIIKVFGNITNPRTKELIPYNSIARVKYGENIACFLYHIIGSNVSSNFRYTKADGLNYKVIGNLYQNAELMEG